MTHCETCGKEIPEKEEEEPVEFNGHEMKLQQCKECSEKDRKKMDRYPKK
jgi:hypothetical protein